MTSSIESHINELTSKFFNTSRKIEAGNEAVSNFIHNPQCLVLFAYREKENVEFTDEIMQRDSATLVFYKTSKIALDEKYLHEIGITAFPTNAVESFYLALRYIYGPVLQMNSILSLDQKIQEIIVRLEATLRITANDKDGGPSLTVVLSIDDEMEYWRTIEKESKSQKQKEMSHSFLSILENLSKEMILIEALDVNEIQEVLENACGFIDDLWRHSTFIYPQKRMKHLMEIIGNNCIQRLEHILNSFDIWHNKCSILADLNNCMETAILWQTLCNDLTSKYWPHHSLHTWEGPPHSSANLTRFINRLNQIIEIRLTHSQLMMVLTNSEQKELETSELFDPFKRIKMWNLSSKDEEIWKIAKMKFDKLLKPAEEKVSLRLQQKLSKVHPKQMIHEFIKYSTLFERPNIFKSLSKERGILMNNINLILNEIVSDLNNADQFHKNNYNAPEMSPLVQQSQWIKKQIQQVTDIENLIKKLFPDSPSQKELLHLTSTTLNELQSTETQLYEDWTRSLQMELNTKSIIVSPESPVVEFSPENNLMRVTFNPKLVSLERDIRHMSAIGYVVPPQVKEAVNYAAQFMDHARALEQVAHFHNTQGDRMILSQRPMMLRAAIQLESIVKEQTTVLWKDIHLVGQYVDKLKSAVSTLIQQNTFLSSQHSIIRNIVLSLMDSNILQKQDQWKTSIREIRNIIDKVEMNGYTNSKIWKTHWDLQLYKALEHQYRNILINPLPHLSTIKVELTFRQGLQLQPPIEELRSLCHKQLKKLISLPMHFVGIQPHNEVSQNIFTSIIKRNAWMISGALLQIEKTLDKVQNSTQKWRKWVALGHNDLDNLCELHLSHAQDWEKNFKECKSIGQTLAKLPLDDEKIDWIWISNNSLRNELESQNRRYWISLVTSLQSSLQKDITNLETYIFAAQNSLNQIVPKNAKELALASENFNAIKHQKIQMNNLLEGLIKKQHMSRAWGGERTRSFEYLTMQWDNLVNQMQTYEQLIIHQAGTVKMGLTNSLSNLTVSLEAWYLRWKENKPKTDQIVDNSLLETNIKYELYSEATTNWNIFMVDKQNIIDECKKFEMEIELSPLWKDVEKSMKEDEDFWNIFKAFHDELQDIHSEEWIIFQNKLHILDSFIIEWEKKIEPLTVLTLIIQREITKYKDILPILKYLKGSEFTERHWAEIYSLLEILIAPKEKLTAGHLLNVSHNIKLYSKDLQRIWQSASNEAVIRGAVTELELWLAGTRLIIAKHKDVRGSDVPIVKDYKQIIIKLEEYQSLVSSARSVSGETISDQLNLWETRLDFLKSSLSSLAFIQRNDLFHVISHTRKNLHYLSGSSVLLYGSVFCLRNSCEKAQKKLAMNDRQ